MWIGLVACAWATSPADFADYHSPATTDAPPGEFIPDEEPTPKEQKRLIEGFRKSGRMGKGLSGHSAVLVPKAHDVEAAEAENYHDDDDMSDVRRTDEELQDAMTEEDMEEERATDEAMEKIEGPHEHRPLKPNIMDFLGGRRKTSEESTPEPDPWDTPPDMTPDAIHRQFAEINAEPTPEELGEPTPEEEAEKKSKRRKDLQAALGLKDETGTAPNKHEQVKTNEEVKKFQEDAEIGLHRNPTGVESRVEELLRDRNNREGRLREFFREKEAKARGEDSTRQRKDWDALQAAKQWSKDHVSDHDNDEDDNADIPTTPRDLITPTEDALERNEESTTEEGREEKKKDRTLRKQRKKDKVAQQKRWEQAKGAFKVLQKAFGAEYSD